MRRHILGIIAMAFLLGAAALWLWSPGEKYCAAAKAMACRVGVFLAVWWLAYPDVDRLPGWLLLALPAAVGGHLGSAEADAVGHSRADRAGRNPAAVGAALTFRRNGPYAPAVSR